MTNRFFNPDVQFFNTTGVPLAGGSLTFYVSGSSTPLATFSDSALSVPNTNTNPVVLDSAGRAGSIFLQNAAYKVVLADALGSPIWTQDPVWSSDYSSLAQFQVYPGNPNGHVAGNQGTVGGIGASVVWDSTDQAIFICTISGSTTTAVWTQFSTGGGGGTSVPTGSILSYGGSSAPSGFVLCGGQAISRATFATLFSVIGTTYGVGDGATTFNVPDLRGRVPAGQDTMSAGAANRITSVATDAGTIVGANLGSTGGSSTHALATGEIPSHNHGVTDPGHTHDVKYGTNVAQGGVAFTAVSNISSGGGTTGSGGAVSNTTGISINNTGGGGAHAILQPTIITTYIIKT